MTKYAITAACVIAAAGVAWVILSDWPIQPRAATRPGTITRRTPAPAGSWPIFRGGPALRGLADGHIPDALERRWRFRTGDAVRSSPVIGGGKVFIGSDDGHIYALHLGTGEKEWSYKTDGAVEAPPTLADGTVYVGSKDEFLYALDAGNGGFRWKYKANSQIVAAVNHAQAPAGVGTWIILAAHDNTIHCVDAATGKGVWTHETQTYVLGAPTVGNGRIVFGSCDDVVHVLSLANGEELAAINAGAFVTASSALAVGQAYVGNHNGELLRIDIAGAEVQWRYRSEDRTDDNPIFSSAAVGADRVVFGSRDRRVHCVARSDGKRIWTFPTRGGVDSSPVICGQKVVAASRDGRLYVLRLADGEKLWSYEIGQPITSSPAVAGGMIVVGCEDGYVYAFGPKQ